MNLLQRISGLSRATTLIILADFLVACSAVYLYITSTSKPFKVSLNAPIGKTTHNLAIGYNGTLSISWIEKQLDDSSIAFAHSVDFGRKWSQNAKPIFTIRHHGIAGTENKLDNLSMVVDSSGKAHISFMKNLRTKKSYGDVCSWSLVYITNESGDWSSPITIKDPWNDDWMGGILRGGDRRGYSEGVRALRIDVDSDDVLHVASKHDGWWGWGAPLYHHFKAKDSDWYTEEVGWHRVGKIGTDNQARLRVYYLLRKMAYEKDVELRDLGLTNFEALKAGSNKRIGYYRGDPKYANHDCWKKALANVDCPIQGDPLLYVSPAAQLYIFNFRFDDNFPYFQRISSSNFWRKNQLLGSEICPYNEPGDRDQKWQEYKRVYNGNFKMEPRGLIKATFDRHSRYHLCMVAEDRKGIYYYVEGAKAPYKVYSGDFVISEADIAIVNGIPHLVFIEEGGDGTSKLFWAFKHRDGPWQQPKQIDVTGLEVAKFRELNAGRPQGLKRNKDGLPFLGITFKAAPKNGDRLGELYFLRVTDIPPKLAWDALLRTGTFFGLSSAILLVVFLYLEALIGRKQPFNVKMKWIFIVALVCCLIAKDAVAFSHRDALFLSTDPMTLLRLLGAVLSAFILIISSYQRIVAFFKTLFAGKD